MGTPVVKEDSSDDEEEKTVDEVNVASNNRKCTKCGEAGHNRAACAMQSQKVAPRLEGSFLACLEQKEEEAVMDEEQKVDEGAGMDEEKEEAEEDEEKEEEDERKHVVHVHVPEVIDLTMDDD